MLYQIKNTLLLTNMDYLFLNTKERNDWLVWAACYNNNIEEEIQEQYHNWSEQSRTKSIASELNFSY